MDRKMGAVLTAILLAGTAAAQEYGPIISLTGCTARAQVLRAYESGLEVQARECLDAGLPAAIDAAGDSAELVSAIKDYYVAATAWTKSDIGRDTASAQARDAALARMTMEAKLAGKWQ